jgi:hypothetical protein
VEYDEGREIGEEACRTSHAGCGRFITGLLSQPSFKCNLVGNLLSLFARKLLHFGHAALQILQSTGKKCSRIHFSLHFFYWLRSPGQSTSWWMRHLITSCSFFSFPFIHVFSMAQGTFFLYKFKIQCHDTVEMQHFENQEATLFRATGRRYPPSPVTIHTITNQYCCPYLRFHSYTELTC